MLGKLVSATARPLNAATGAAAVIVAVFGIMTAFNVGLSPEQESAIVVFVAVAGQYLVGVTGSNTLRRIIGDPTIPSIEPGDPVPVRALRSPLTAAPAPDSPAQRVTGDDAARHRLTGDRAAEPEGPWT